MRTAEARAREHNAGAQRERGGEQGRKRKAGEAHPDQEQAAREIADALGGALGADVRVKAVRGGSYRAELSFATPEEAIELARRVRPRVVA